jgi:hypothetical protein
MNTYTLLLVFVAYLLIVVYVQHDRQNIRYKRALYNTFVAPFYYLVFIPILMLVHGCVHLQELKETIIYNMRRSKK